MKSIRLLFVLGLMGSTVSASLLVSRGPLGVDAYSNSGVFLGNLIAPGAGGLTDAQGVAQLPSGDLLVGDFNNDNILRFTAGGTFLGVFASGVDVNTPFDVVYGPDGNVYVASANNVSNVAKLNGVTGAVIASNFPSGSVTPIGGPQYIAFGPTMALTDIAGHLFRFNPVTGAHISTFFLDNPEGVAFNAAGDLFVAQRISDNILRFPFGGGPGQIVVPNGAFGGSSADIAIGPDGLLYVSTDQIYRFDVSGANGVLVDSFGTGGEFIVFVSDVPEPATGVMLMIGVVAAAAMRYRKSRSV